MFNYAFVLWSVLSTLVVSTNDVSQISRSVSDANQSITQAGERDFTCNVMATSPKHSEKIPYTRVVSAPDVGRARSDFQIRADAWALKLHYKLDMSTLSCK